MLAESSALCRWDWKTPSERFFFFFCQDGYSGGTGEGAVCLTSYSFFFARILFEATP